MEINFNNIIIPPDKVNTYKHLVESEDWKWIFFGEDPILREKIINFLPEGNRIYYARSLQKIASNNKQKFLNIIANIGKINNNSKWWSTILSYKSPLSTNVFTNFCYFIYINKILRENNNTIIIIENPFLYKDVREKSKNSNNLISKDNIRYLLLKYKLICSSFINVNYFLLKSIIKFISTKIITFKYRNTINEILSRKDCYDVLTCTWIEERSFNNNTGHFIDPYLKGLYNFCVEEKKTVITTTLPFIPRNLIEKSLKSKAIIPLFYFGNILDIFKTYIKILKFRINLSKFEKKAIGTKNIFKNDILKEKGRIGQSILHYYLFKKLIKSKIKFKNVVYPFENQPYERMICTAIKNTDKKINIIGHQHSSVPKYFLNYFLGNGESNIIPQPDFIVANGKSFTKILEGSGFSAKILNGGSLRFSSASSGSTSTNKNPPNNINDNVLIILSYSINYSIDLLFYLIRKNNFIKKYFIKPHPNFPESIIRKYIKTFPKNFFFASGSMQNWLYQVKFAIHNGTTAIIECVEKDIIAYKYLPERIDLDPLVDMDVKQYILSDRDELQFNQEEMKEQQTKVNFEPLNEKVWRKILF